MRCLNCGLTADIDLRFVHEPDRRCYACKYPWVPDDYHGRIIDRRRLITPSTARRWLETIPDGSGHWTQGRPSRARYYAEVMRSGEWVDGGKPVMFDAHGVLLTGVLRLLACVEANTSFRARVVRFDRLVPGFVPFVGDTRKAKLRNYARTLVQPSGVM